MRVNKLRRTLKAGGRAIGTLVLDVKGRGMVHTLVAAGMDFIMICTEHSSFSLETVVDMMAHAHAAGITPVVRIPTLQSQYITRVLDNGCQSLIVPTSNLAKTYNGSLSVPSTTIQGNGG